MWAHHHCVRWWKNVWIELFELKNYTVLYNCFFTPLIPLPCITSLLCFLISYFCVITLVSSLISFHQQYAVFSLILVCLRVCMFSRVNGGAHPPHGWTTPAGVGCAAPGESWCSRANPRPSLIHSPVSTPAPSLCFCELSASGKNPTEEEAVTLFVCEHCVQADRS